MTKLLGEYIYIFELCIQLDHDLFMFDLNSGRGPEILIQIEWKMTQLYANVHVQQSYGAGLPLAELSTQIDSSNFGYQTIKLAARDNRNSHRLHYRTHKVTPQIVRSVKLLFI
jgi:hypothetical protein